MKGAFDVVLGSKRAEDVYPSEIEALVDQRVMESQSLDFKREPWGKTSSEKCERLRDIVAMANGGGGYILLGVVEDAAGRASKIARVPDAAKQVESILNAVTDGIVPRMSSIQAAVNTTSRGDMVLIRVPPADPLYAVAVEQREEFWCRYGTTKNRMRIEEIMAAARGDRTLIEVREQRPTGEPVEGVVPPHAWQFRNAMDLRADDEIGDTHYYRATITPHNLSRSIVLSHDLRELLSRPPRPRPMGFGIRHLELHQHLDGLLGTDTRGCQVILQRNGYLELRAEMTTDFYIEDVRGSAEDTHLLLNQWVLIETAIAFHRLVDAVYSIAGVSGPGTARHSLYNISEFHLAPSQWTDWQFAEQYKGQEFVGGDVIVADLDEFDPDAVVHAQMTEFYAAFGFSPEMIPLFDEDNHFQP